MHETPRRFKLLRPVAALLLMTGSVVVADSLTDAPVHHQATEQAPTKYWFNLNFILPKLVVPTEITTTTTTSTATTTLPPTTTTAPSAKQTPNAINDSGATNAFTPDWYRCVINPESGGNPNQPGTGGEFGFETSTWQSNPYAQVWQSQEPAGANWSLPWEAPLYIQAEAALILYTNNGGFGPTAWNNSANCGKSG